MKKNYNVINLGNLNADLANRSRIELGDKIGLTGCEVSVNYIAPGQYIPFLHSHELNEEVYIILKGNGIFIVDGEKFPVQEGSVVRVAPSGHRSIGSEREELVYLCIQAQSDSLTQATWNDGIRQGGEQSDWRLG